VWLLLLSSLACSRADPGVRIESVPSASPPSTHAPADGPVRVAVPRGLNDPVSAALPAVQAVAGRPVVTVAGDAPSDLRLVVTTPDGPDPVVRRWSVVAAAGRLDLDGVTRSDLSRASIEGRLFVTADDLELVQPVVPDGGLVPVPADELPGRLASVRGALAILPADTVSVRVRALALDGADPVTGTGNLDAYPLVTRAHAETSGDDEGNALLADVLMQELTRAGPPPIRITFTGDLIPARCVYDRMRRSGDWEAPFRPLAERLSGADITVGSLDAAISAQGTPIGCRETFSLLAPPQVVQGFGLAGFDVITVASNHAKDCGESGGCGDATLLDTLAVLRSAGIEPVGGGGTLTEARQPAIVAAGGVRFAFLGYDDIAAYYHAGESRPGTAPLDETTLAEDIGAARRLADVVVVLPHWGEEYTPHPTDRQRRLTAAAIDAGATLVVGNHPHVVQAATPLADGYVAFALGNFIFDQDWSVETTEGVVLEATFRGTRLAAVRFLPVRIEDRLRTVPLAGDDARRVLGRMMDATARLGE
jgi:poly-gamma-glutamate synthesis protein (capsule biosynthesis protein)